MQFLYFVWPVDINTKAKCSRTKLRNTSNLFNSFRCNDSQHGSVSIIIRGERFSIFKGRGDKGCFSFHSGHTAASERGKKSIVFISRIALKFVRVLALTHTITHIHTHADTPTHTHILLYTMHSTPHTICSMLSSPLTHIFAATTWEVLIQVFNFPKL